jgi:hypothetical protein
VSEGQVSTNAFRKGRGSAVGIASGYGLEDGGVEFESR